MASIRSEPDGIELAQANSICDEFELLKIPENINDECVICLVK